MKRNVLFLTYHYPPSASSGVYRPAKMVKYLFRGEAWNPIVLTIEEAYYGHSIDPSLSVDIPEGLELHRVPSLQPLLDSSDDYKKIYHQVHLPDHAVGGIMHFVLKGLQIIHEKPVDLIFCTIPHPSIAIAGSMLKQLTGIPLVVDYRDGWTTNPMVKFRSREGYEINRYLEKNVISSADGLVVVDQQLERDLSDFGFKGNVMVLPNGFDPEDFENGGAYPIEKEPLERIISYCGYIYSAYVPTLIKLADAIGMWNESAAHDQRIRFVVAGDIQTEKDRQVIESAKNIRYVGRLNYRDSIGLITGSEASVGIMTMEYSMGGKFYNLICANQYIFAFAHPNNQGLRENLQPYTRKKIFDLDVTAHEIMEGFHEWLSDGPNPSMGLPGGEMQHFNRKKQVERLERFFQLITDHRDTGND